jgi:ABC-type spermidine/putrescine transport system permease subunit I
MTRTKGRDEGLWVQISRNRRVRIGFFVLPATAYLFAFLILPMISILIFSFWKTERYVLIPDWNVQNYVHIFTQWAYIKFLMKSVSMAVFVSAVCLLYGYPVAYFIAKEGGQYRLLLLMLTATPFFTGTLLRIISMQHILGPIGLLNMFLMKVGLPPIQILMYTNLSSSIGFVYLWIPFMILAVYLSLLNFDFELLEVAKICGATPLRAFWEVTLPLNWVGTVAGIVMVFIPTLADNATPLFLGGMFGKLYGNILFNQFGESGTWAMGSAMGVVLFIVSFVVIGIFGKSINLRKMGYIGG